MILILCTATKQTVPYKDWCEWGDVAISNEFSGDETDAPRAKGKGKQPARTVAAYSDDDIAIEISTDEDDGSSNDGPNPRPKKLRRLIGSFSSMSMSKRAATTTPNMAEPPFTQLPTSTTELTDTEQPRTRSPTPTESFQYPLSSPVQATYREPIDKYGMPNIWG